MKNSRLKYIGLLLFTVLFAACETEEELTPSYADSNRVEDFLSQAQNAYVNEVYNRFGCGLMYEYDNILDFAYTAENATAAGKWGAIEIPMMQKAFLNAEGEMTSDSLENYNAYVDKGLAFIDSALIQYFGTSGYIATHMPFKVLLSNGIFTTTSVANTVLTESDSRVGTTAENSLNCVYNDNSIVINVNQDGLLFNADKFRKDNFYIFLVRMLEMHDLYDEIPGEFSDLSSPYYGLTIENVYADEYGIDLDDEESDTIPDVIDKTWFYGKGFVDARYFYNRSQGIGLTTINGEAKAIRRTYSFVADLETDFRSYLNEAIHRNADELVVYPATITDKMKLLIQTFDEWGVDIVAFNPDLEILYTE